MTPQLCGCRHLCQYRRAVLCRRCHGVRRSVGAPPLGAPLLGVHASATRAEHAGRDRSAPNSVRNVSDRRDSEAAVSAQASRRTSDDATATGFGHRLLLLSSPSVAVELSTPAPAARSGPPTGWPRIDAETSG